MDSLTRYRVDDHLPAGHALAHSVTVRPHCQFLLPHIAL